MIPNKAKRGFNLMRANIIFSSGHVYTEIKMLVILGFMMSAINSRNYSCTSQLPPARENCEINHTIADMYFTCKLYYFNNCTIQPNN